MTLDVTLFGFHGPPPALASAEAILSQLPLLVNSFFHLFRCFFKLTASAGSPVSDALPSIPLLPTLVNSFFHFFNSTGNRQHQSPEKPESYIIRPALSLLLANANDRLFAFLVLSITGQRYAHLSPPIILSVPHTATGMINHPFLEAENLTFPSRTNENL